MDECSNINTTFKVSTVSKKNSGSWLGDKSVQKARGEGTIPTFPCSAPNHSVPHLCGSQHPMPLLMLFYPLMVGTLLATAVSIKIPVCLLATK